MRNIGDVISVMRRHDSYAFVDFQNPEDAATAVAALNGSPTSTWTGAKGKGGNGTAVVSLQLAAELGGVMMQNATVKVLWYRPETSVGRRDEDCDFVDNGFWGMGGRGHGRGRGHGYQAVLSHKKKTQKENHQQLDDCDDGTAVVRSILEEFGPLSSFEKQATTHVTTEDRGSSGGGAAQWRGRGEGGRGRGGRGRGRGIAQWGENHAVMANQANKRKALVKFAFSEDAHRAVKAIAQRDKIPSLGGTKLFIESVYTIKFTLLNPVYAIVGREVPLPIH